MWYLNKNFLIQILNTIDTINIGKTKKYTEDAPAQFAGSNKVFQLFNKIDSITVNRIGHKKLW